jgi:hypothetical protein
MTKVFENREIAIVGLMQSHLEAIGIPTVMRNQGLNQLGGEIPFNEIWPELWVVNDSDLEAARAIVVEFRSPPTGPPPLPWTCLNCGETVDGNFAQCWNCDSPRGE